MATSPLSTPAAPARPSLNGLQLLGLVILGIAAMALLGVGADPTRVDRRVLAFAQHDWVAPDADMAAMAGLAPAHGSLDSLARHELRDEQHKAIAEAHAPHPHSAAPVDCEVAWLGQQTVLSERHGRATPRAYDRQPFAHGRDTRERVHVVGHKLPALDLPEAPQDICAPPSSFWRLAGFIEPPRLARQMGYLPAGYYAPI